MRQRVRMSRYWARGKSGEHESGVRVAQDIDKIIEGKYQNYVIDKLTFEIMEIKPLGSRM